jgi:hypothetical protein
MVRRYIYLQNGATLLVVMVMLILMTLMSLATYKLSSTNQRIVTNTQFRQEAISAADVVFNGYLRGGDGYIPGEVKINGNTYNVTIADATKNVYLRPFMNVTSTNIASVETMDNWLEKWIFDKNKDINDPDKIIDPCLDDNLKSTPMVKKVCELHASLSKADLEKRERIFSHYCNPTIGSGKGAGLVIAAGMDTPSASSGSSSGSTCNLPCYFQDFTEVEVTVTDPNTKAEVKILTGYSNGELKTVEELRSAGLCS